MLVIIHSLFWKRPTVHGCFPALPRLHLGLWDVLLTAIESREVCAVPLVLGESPHEPRHRASRGILKRNRQCFVISLPQSLFKLINTAVCWWTGLILYCWAQLRLRHVILRVMPLKLLRMYLRTSHKCNRKKKTRLQTLPFVRIINIIGIVNSSLCMA